MASSLKGERVQDVSILDPLSPLSRFLSPSLLHIQQCLRSLLFLFFSSPYSNSTLSPADFLPSIHLFKMKLSIFATFTLVAAAVANGKLGPTGGLRVETDRYQKDSLRSSGMSSDKLMLHPQP